MSLYVRVYTNFYTSRKTAFLRSVLGDDAYWIPPRIWAYAATDQPDGDLSRYSAQMLANLIGYTKDAASMLQALLDAGFLDSDPLRIHDWEEHNSYHLSYAERAKAAADARWAKRREKAAKREEKRRTDLRGEEPSIAPSMLVASQAEEFGLTIPQNLRTANFLQALEEWISYRKTRAACKDWVRMFQKQLEWLGEFPEPTAKAMIDQSIRFNWQGLFKLGQDGNNNNSSSTRNGGTTADKRNAVISGADRIRADLEACGDADDLPFLPG